MMQHPHVVALSIGLSLVLNLSSGSGQQAESAMTGPGSAEAQREDAPPAIGPPFAEVLQSYAGQLEALATDQDALTLFASRLGHALNLSEAAGVLRAGPRAASSLPGMTISDLETRAVRLTATLAVWRTALTLREADESTDGQGMTALSERVQEQVPWLSSHAGTTMPPPLISLLEAQQWARSIPGADFEHPSYETYRAALDRAYPESTGTDDAWIPSIEREGASVLRQRLITDLVGAPVPESIRAQMAARYIRQRLAGLMESRIRALSAEMEREAVLSAHRDWFVLHSLREQVRTAAGLARLCGAWQWTVHNHRNHGDHKSAVVFAPPGEAQAGTARPTEIVALGDVIYLRWEFPGGVVQEDSLLFTAEGKRLEGSFVNSAGSWGNISGKKLKGCKGAAEPSTPSHRKPTGKSRPRG